MKVTKIFDHENLELHGNTMIPVFKVVVKWFVHAINCFINTAETKPTFPLNCRYSVNNSGSWQVI